MRYEKIRQLGDNDTWLIRDLSTGGELVLRHYNPTPANKAALIQEIEAEQMLNHPNVLATLEVGEDAEGVYTLRPYCPNGTCMKFAGTASPELAKKIEDEATAGMNYLHNRGLAHGKISLNNILSYRGHYVLADRAMHALGEQATQQDDRLQLARAFYELREGHRPASNAALPTIEPVSVPQPEPKPTPVETPKPEPKVEPKQSEPEPQEPETTPAEATEQETKTETVKHTHETPLKPIKTPVFEDESELHSSLNNGEERESATFEDRTRDDRLPAEPPKVNIMRWFAIIGIVLGIALAIYGIVEGIIWLNERHIEAVHEQHIADSLALEAHEDSINPIPKPVRVSKAYLDTAMIWDAAEVPDTAYARFVKMFHQGRVTDMKNDSLTATIQNEKFVHIMQLTRKLDAKQVRDVFVNRSKRDRVDLKKIDEELIWLSR